jgi:hypothetical protein
MQKYNSAERPGPEDYTRAVRFTSLVRKSEFLTPDEKHRLYLQAVHGDLKGAWDEYDRLATGNQVAK